MPSSPTFRVCSSMTSTFPSPATTPAFWRSLQMVCPSSVVSSLLWTPLWFLQSSQWSPAPSLCRGGWCRLSIRPPAETIDAPRALWSFWQGSFGGPCRREVVGRMKPTLSFASWQKQVPSRLGTTGGVPCSLVPAPGRLLCPCLNVILLWVVMETRLPRLTSLPLAATCRSFLCCEQGLTRS